MQNLKCLVLSAVCFFCGYAASLSWAEEIAVWKEVMMLPVFGVGMLAGWSPKLLGF